MIIQIEVPGGRVLADATLCMLILAQLRFLIRTDKEYQHARMLARSETHTADECAAMLNAIQDAWEYHNTQAADALLRRAALAGAGVLVVRRGQPQEVIDCYRAAVEAQEVKP